MSMSRCWWQAVLAAAILIAFRPASVVTETFAAFSDASALQQSVLTGTWGELEITHAIQGLLDRGYLVKNGKALSATPAAFSLIDAVPRAIADPGTTAIWEQALDMVQSGEMSLEEFVAKQAAWMSKQVTRCTGMRLTISGPASPAGRGATPWKNKRKPAKRKTATSPKRAAKPANKG